MKRNLLVISILVFSLLTAGIATAKVIKVGATPVPHAEILEIIVEDLKTEGITLQIIEFTDYLTPNLALQDNELDANFFQHLPYLEGFNEDRGADLVSLAGIHVEPLGVYSQKISSLADLPKRAQISIPNDASNGTRALLLLQEAGLIKLDPKAGIEPSVFDIIENKLNIKFVELEAAQLSRTLPDVHAAVINGNYALQADFNPIKDSIFLEGAESPYVNILAVRSDDVDNPDLLKLAEILRSEKVKTFIEESYGGGVVPVF
ncbi:MAG: MetQ/NlpA family ABC transporter substrate-binding protein [Bacillota bacterium]|nr:MetQ/NlpA family ABC transporter substrate-binding protein [Bacillota bacterium]